MSNPSIAPRTIAPTSRAATLRSITFSDPLVSQYEKRRLGQNLCGRSARKQGRDRLLHLGCRVDSSRGISGTGGEEVSLIPCRSRSPRSSGGGSTGAQGQGVGGRLLAFVYADAWSSARPSAFMPSSWTLSTTRRDHSTSDSASMRLLDGPCRLYLPACIDRQQPSSTQRAPELTHDRHPQRHPRQPLGRRPPSSPTSTTPRRRAIVCLEDLDDYGPDPVACIDLVRQRCEVVLLGDCDQRTMYMPEDSSVPTTNAEFWTRQRLDSAREDKKARRRRQAFLAELPQR